jgi:hypothetical protein
MNDDMSEWIVRSRTAPSEPLVLPQPATHKDPDREGLRGRGFSTPRGADGG